MLRFTLDRPKAVLAGLAAIVGRRTCSPSAAGPARPDVVADAVARFVGTRRNMVGR